MIKNINVSELDKNFLKNTKYKIDKCNIDFKDILVKKPWGEEYLLFENKNCAIWVLYIKYMHNTSMHCHINKKTSLICIDGQVSCNTLSTNNILNPLDALILEKTVFHQTNSITKKGSFILEIETPVNKFDLVRINDEYGRRGKDYENKKFYKNIKDLTFNMKNKSKSINNCKIEIIINNEYFNKDKYSENSLVYILSNNQFNKVMYLKDLDILEIEKNIELLILSENL